jgi:hypothetical protein
MIAIAWVLIGLGVLIGVTTFIRLGRSHAWRSGSAPPTKVETWVGIGTGVLPALTGLTILSYHAKNQVVLWASRCCGLLVAIVVVFLLSRPSRQGKRRTPTDE